jgi:hypothetical protein
METGAWSRLDAKSPSQIGLRELDPGRVQLRYARIFVMFADTQ